MARGQAELQTGADATPTPKKRTRSASTRSTSTQRRRKRPVTASRIMKDAVSDDVEAMRAEVTDMMALLQAKLDRLNQLTKQSAGHAAEGANDVVVNALSNLTGQMTGRARDQARSASDEVAKVGGQAIRRVFSEIDKRPFLTLAIAAGIGFIAGLARPRE